MIVPIKRMITLLVDEQIKKKRAHFLWMDVVYIEIDCFF